MSTQLGPFSLEHPFLLAPMAGITNSPFRRLMRKQGSSLVVSELVSANGLEHASRRTMDLLRYHDDERVVGLQIFGDDVNYLVRACQYIEKTGADFVDLNLGCPVPKVVKNGAGAALCRNPVELGKILAAMVQSVKIPVTIKIRTGWDQESRNALQVLRVAQDAGVAWVAIHGRTRAQGYSGLADWDFIGELKAKTQIPIIGNGDVHTPQQAVERYKTYAVDAVMIGRGALRNPFIFRQANELLGGRDPEKIEADGICALIDEQRTYLEETFAGRGVSIHARKFLAWYSAGYPGSSEFRKKVFQDLEGDELWETAKSFFKNAMKNRDLNHLNEPFLMGGHG
jgi:tRNA-dihydrouridine synthase B